MKSLSSHTTSSLFCESVEDDAPAEVTILGEVLLVGAVVELEESSEEVTLLSVIEFLLESVELFKTAALVVKAVFAVSEDLEGTIFSEEFSEGFTEVLSKVPPPQWMFQNLPQKNLQS